MIGSRAGKPRARAPPEATSVYVYMYCARVFVCVVCVFVCAYVPSIVCCSCVVCLLLRGRVCVRLCVYVWVRMCTPRREA